MAKKNKANKAINKKGLRGALLRYEELERFKKNQEQKKEQKEHKQKEHKQKSTAKGSLVQKTTGKGLSAIDAEDRLLLVGEGDFSFARSIVSEGYAEPTRMVATSFDSLAQVKEKYPEVEDNLKYLHDNGVKLMHEIDARELAKSMKLASATGKSTRASKNLFKDHGQINKIMFNFPHTGRGMKDVDRNIADHQKLMLAFFTSCNELFNILEQDSSDNAYFTLERKVVVTMFEGEPYASWGVKSLAKSQDFTVERSGRFDWQMYPTYHHKRTTSNRDTTKPAAERAARVYIFKKRTELVESKKGHDSDE